MDTYKDMMHIYKYRYDTCWPKRASTWQSCELKKGKPNSARFWPQNAGRVDESILRWTFFKKLVWTQNVRLASTRTTFLRNHGTVKDPSVFFYGYNDYPVEHLNYRKPLNVWRFRLHLGSMRLMAHGSRDVALFPWWLLSGGERRAV